MIGRWGSWPLFINAYMIASCEERGLTSYGGCLLARGILRLSPSIELFRFAGRFLFLGRVFGNPKLLLEWLFLFGQRFIVDPYSRQPWKEGFGGSEQMLVM